MNAARPSRSRRAGGRSAAAMSCAISALNREHVFFAVGPSARTKGENRCRRRRAAPSRASRSCPLRTLPSSSDCTPSRRPMSRTSSARFLNANVEVRAATRNPGTCVSSLMISSAMPSQKYSWSCSGLMSTNGNTATDGSAAFVTGGAALRLRAAADSAPLASSADEAKAASLHGSDHGLPVTVVARERPRLLDDLRERGFRHDRVRPQILEQLVLVDHAIAVLDEIDETDRTPSAALLRACRTRALAAIAGAPRKHRSGIPRRYRWAVCVRVEKRPWSAWSRRSV